MPSSVWPPTSALIRSRYASEWVWNVKHARGAPLAVFAPKMQNVAGRGRASSTIVNQKY